MHSSTTNNMATPLCEACSKTAPRPLLACLACINTHDTHDKATPTHYCDTHCRTADELKHKTICENKNTLEQLCRAAELLKDISWCFRFVAFDLKVKRIEKTNGVLRVYEAEYTDHKDDGPVYPFPKAAATREDSCMMASFMACNDSLAYVYDLSKELLQGLTTTVEEIKVRISVPWRVIRYYPNGQRDRTECAHAVLAVECTNGEAYIIDLAGAQFGQRRAILPFDEYMNRFVTEVRQIHPHGNAREYSDSVRTGEKNHEFAPTFDFRTIQFSHVIQQVFDNAKRNWERKNKMTAQEVLKLEGPAFAKARTTFIDDTSDQMVLFTDKWRKTGRKLPKHPKQSAASAARGKATVKEKCTVKPEGEGSHAYQKWLEDSKKYEEDPNDPFAGLAAKFMGPDWLKSFTARGGNVSFF